MIPISLTISNFLPYRNPDPVRFEGIHLACLTGSNGAGKSSLLDAITWAIWGKARARREDDLVHMGQGDMYVQLDFEQENVRYRVLRRRSAGKRGQGTLDFFVFATDNAPQNITEPSMRATQTRINALLRLDYDTFVHSAFLQQGKADAFTTRPPAERKKILSDILGLERWTAYEDNVKEKLKGITTNIQLFEMRIEEIERELAQRPALERELSEAQKVYEQAQGHVKAAEARLKEVENAPTDLKHARTTREAIAARLRELERDKAQVLQNMDSVQAQIDTYSATLAQEQDILAGYAALQSARDADAQLGEKLRKLAPINAQRAQVEQALIAARTRLETDLSALQRRRDDLLEQLTQDPSAEAITVQAEVSELQAQDHDRTALEAQISGWKEKRAETETQRRSIEAEGHALREQLDKLQSAAPDLAICPTCGQSLSEEHRVRVITELEETIQAKRDDYKEAQAQVAALDTELKEANATLKTLNTELKRLAPLLQRLGTLQQLAESHTEAQTTLDSVQTEIAALEAALSSEDYAEDARAQLAELDTQRTKLGYDDSAAESARAEIDAHAQYEGLHTRLSVARESLPGYVNQLEAYQRQITNLETAQAAKATEAEGIDAEIARLLVLVEEFQRREQELNTQRTVERNSYERVVTCRQSLDALQQQAERKAQLSERRDATRAQEALYNELKRAFGRNGVPAMIIESAIPELEQTANALLSKMTDGRMHLRLNTQRERVTGGQMETLEIAIADELGERNYELYSGGEAFRINFAIRVALSQMLARRAGAHLRTLFIDEGFGTQDDNGRTKLVEAINAIQNEFDMVLVITHIDELRDSFPVHIEVEKTANGSRIAVR